MGRRGPMPKPADQILGHRKRRVVTTKVPKAIVPPAPPDFLPQTVEAWRIYWQSDLASLSLAVDGQALGRLFAMYDQHARAMDIVSKALLVKGSTGQLRTNPLAEHALKLESAIVRLENELGLTPAARSRFGIKLSDEKAQAKPAAAQPSHYRHLKVVGE
jgi:P27 family predicted phage terminase small subunit